MRDKSSSRLLVATTSFVVLLFLQAACTAAADFEDAAMMATEEGVMMASLLEVDDQNVCPCKAKPPPGTLRCVPNLPNVRGIIRNTCCDGLVCPLRGGICCGSGSHCCPANTVCVQGDPGTPPGCLHVFAKKGTLGHPLLPRPQNKLEVVINKNTGETIPKRNALVYEDALLPTKRNAVSKARIIQTTNHNIAVAKGQPPPPYVPPTSFVPAPGLSRDAPPAFCNNPTYCGLHPAACEKSCQKYGEMPSTRTILQENAELIALLKNRGIELTPAIMDLLGIYGMPKGRVKDPKGQEYLVSLLFKKDPNLAKIVRTDNNVPTTVSYDGVNVSSDQNSVSFLKQALTALKTGMGSASSPASSSASASSASTPANSGSATATGVNPMQTTFAPFVPTLTGSATQVHPGKLPDVNVERNGQFQPVTGADLAQIQATSSSQNVLDKKDAVAESLSSGIVGPAGTPLDAAAQMAAALQKQLPPTGGNPSGGAAGGLSSWLASAYRHPQGSVAVNTDHGVVKIPVELQSRIVSAAPNTIDSTAATPTSTSPSSTEKAKKKKNRKVESEQAAAKQQQGTSGGLNIQTIDEAGADNFPGAIHIVYTNKKISSEELRRKVEDALASSPSGETQQQKYARLSKQAQQYEQDDDAVPLGKNAYNEDDVDANGASATFDREENVDVTNDANYEKLSDRNIASASAAEDTPMTSKKSKVSSSSAQKPKAKKASNNKASKKKKTTKSSKKKKAESSSPSFRETRFQEKIQQDSPLDLPPELTPHRHQSESVSSAVTSTLKRHDRGNNVHQNDNLLSRPYTKNLMAWQK